MKKRSRQSTYYHFTRALIYFALGGRRCARCGEEIYTKRLHLDLITPTPEPDSHHGAMSSTSRAAFFWRHFLAGNVQPLCEVCNSHKRWEESSQVVDNEQNKNVEDC